MKRCKIAPVSCRDKRKPCCQDCTAQDCTVRCQNSPGCCKCVAEGPPPRLRSNGRGGGRFLDWDEIVRLWGQGLAPAQIARQMDCSAKAVYDVLRKREVAGNG